MVRFVMLPERLFVLVCLGTGSFSLRISSCSSRNSCIGSNLSALGSINTGIGSGLGLTRCSITLLGKFKSLIRSCLSTLHGFRRCTTAEQHAGRSNSRHGDELDTHIITPKNNRLKLKHRGFPATLSP